MQRIVDVQRGEPADLESKQSILCADGNTCEHQIWWGVLIEKKKECNTFSAFEILDLSFAYCFPPIT